MRDGGEGKPTAFRIARERAPGLAGISGCVRIQVGARIAGAIKVQDLLVELTVDEREVDTVVRFAAADDLLQVLRGDMNPFAAWMQERLAIEGDPVLGVKVLIGLAAQRGDKSLPRLFVIDGADAGDDAEDSVSDHILSPSLATTGTST